MHLRDIWISCKSEQRMNLNILKKCKINLSDRDYVSHQLPDIPLEYLGAIAFTGRARDTGRLVSSGSISASRPETRGL